MTNNDTAKFQRMVEKLVKELKRELDDRLPRKVGVLAKNHFTENFRKSGFVDGGLTPWQKSKRQLDSNNPNSKYPTLTSRRNHLMRSIQAEPSPGEVLVTNPVPYAELHNDGGELTSQPKVTPKMRKYFWAMMYKSAGIKRRRGRKPKRRKGRRQIISLPPEAQKWRALALTKRTSLFIRARIPQRKFIGESRELTEKINETIQQSLQRIKNGINNI